MSKMRHTTIPAAFLLLRKENHVLLLRRYNTGHEDGNYSLPAGHVDAGESCMQCIIREAKEELGISLQARDLRVAHIIHKKDEAKDYIFIFFTTSSWAGKIINVESHKCDDLSWFETDNLPDNIIPYVKQAIAATDDGVYYSEHGWGGAG